MPKAKKASAAKSLRHDPLAAQIIEEEGKGIRTTPRAKVRRGSTADEEGVIPARVSRKLLEVAQAQKADEGDDIGSLGLDGVGGLSSVGDGGSVGDAASDDEVCDVEVDEDGFVMAQGATDEDERALAMFLPKGGAQKQGQTLADVILSKIKEHEDRAGQAAGSQAGDAEGGLSPKVMQVYGDIGKWLKHYKQGKVPKAFKVIPNLTNWEEVLSITNPLGWSPAAMYEAVKIFASSFNPKMAQRFFNLVLLPAVRQNVAEHKRLNFHYYRALRKSIFKPSAFFKGIVLPMASENCTLREAVILSSVLSKASIPGMHVAAALIHLSRMSPWYGTTSILIAALANKKCALPLQVLESLVAHFYAFVSDSRVLPLVWHRALLIFVQRYKFELSDDQRRRIRELLKVHWHDAVGAEVRRELLAPRPGVAAPAATDGAPAPMDTS